MDIAAVRRGLAAAVSGIPRLQGFAYRPDSINPPTFSVSEYELGYHQTMGSGSVDRNSLRLVTFVCHVFSGRTSADGSEELLERYLFDGGEFSIPAAIESDPTLGGACDTLIVDDAKGVGRLYQPGGDGAPAYYGAELSVRVWG